MKSGSRLCNAVCLVGTDAACYCGVTSGKYSRTSRCQEDAEGGGLRKRTAETTDYITVNKTRGVSRIIPYAIHLSPFSKLHLDVPHTF